MADPLITLEQVQDRLGTVDDTERVETYIEDVSALVRQAAGDDFLDDQGQPDPPGAVVPIMVEAIRRVLDNPHGLASETIGSYTWRADGGDRGLYLSRVEEKMIRRAAGHPGFGEIELDGGMRPYSGWLA